MNKRGLSNIIALLAIILMCIILATAVYIILFQGIKNPSIEIEKKIYATSNINLRVVDIEIENDNLKIRVENIGQKDVVGFIIKIIGTSGTYFNNSIYLLNKEKLEPLTKKTIIIQKPSDIGDYKLIEVYPKFEFQGKEEIAEIGKASFSGAKISSSGGAEEGGGDGNLPYKPIYACSDGADNDGDNLIDLQDTGCENNDDKNESDKNECRIDFKEIDGNLVLNPQVECDNDNNGIPDNWLKDAEDLNHVLSWQYNTIKNSRVLKSEFPGEAEGNYFSWYQNIENIMPDTWYELRADFATEDLKPEFLSTSQISSSSKWTGVSVTLYNSTNKRHANKIAEESIYTQGLKLTDWDEDIGLYRTYTTNTNGWKTFKKYFKTPSTAISARIKTSNRGIGKIYSDNFILKEISENPDKVDFKKSGKLKFVKYKGDFFPIILYGIPQKNNQHIDIDSIKSAGFNSVMINDYRSKSVSEKKQLLLDKNLAAVIQMSYIVNSNLGDFWINDPEHEVKYAGWKATKSLIEDWKGFENLFAFNGPDESSHGPEEMGAYIPDMRVFENMKNYLHNNSGAYLIKNYAGSYPYTGIPSDFVDYYFPNDDILSYTLNSPLAYPRGHNAPYLGNIGEKLRWTIKATAEKGIEKPVLAYGLGVYWWSNWDGRYYEFYNKGIKRQEYLPFNHQRFQIFEQIINGAAGVWFWGTYNMRLEDAYANYHWKQITRISQELSSLYDVLLEPDFYDEWQASDNRIHAMMKKHSGKIYLLTASTFYTDLQNVKITLDSRYALKKITAINEIINGNIDNPINRTITINSDKHSFNDDFTGEYDLSHNITAPGYAVHVYEIEYE